MIAALFVSLITLILLGVPIAVCIGLASMASMFQGGQVAQMFVVAQRMVTAIDSTVLLGIPLFVLAGAIMGKGGIFNRAVGMVLGAFVFRLVYTIALRMNMPAYMLKLVSSTIVVIAIFLPYLKRQAPLMRRRMEGAGKGGN